MIAQSLFEHCSLVILIMIGSCSDVGYSCSAFTPRMLHGCSVVAPWMLQSCFTFDRRLICVCFEVAPRLFNCCSVVCNKINFVRTNYVFFLALWIAVTDNRSNTTEIQELEKDIIDIQEQIHEG